MHLDLSRVGCSFNGCSECLVHIVGDDDPSPAAYRADLCWLAPEPGCAIAYETAGGTTRWGMHDTPAPSYDCAMIDGACTPVPAADRPRALEVPATGTGYRR